MSIRNDILNALTTRIDLVKGTTIKTVKRVEGKLDLQQYARADLPFVAIVEPNESYGYQASRYSLNTLSVNVEVYYLDWNSDQLTVGDTYGPSGINTILDLVLTSIHSDVTNAGTSTGSTAIKSGFSQIMDNYPLFGWRIPLEILYYKDFTTR